MKKRGPKRRRIGAAIVKRIPDPQFAIANPTQKEGATEVSEADRANFTELSAIQRRFLTELPGSAFVISRTSRRCKLHRDTFYDWCSNDENFRRCLDAIFERQLGAVQAAHYRAGIEKGDTLARIHILKSRHSAYSEKVEITHKQLNAVPEQMRQLDAVATVQLMREALQTLARLIPPRDAVAGAKPILDAVVTDAVEKPPLPEDPPEPQAQPAKPKPSPPLPIPDRQPLPAPAELDPVPG